MDQRTFLIETERLRLRWFTLEDAAFIVEQLNEPSFLKNIGDRGVRNLDDARGYLAKGPIASYEKNGFGLNAVELKTSGEILGMCGVLRRDTLEHPDLGFSFLPRYWSKGYAREAAVATMRHAREILQLGRILAVTAPDNSPSIALLEKIGFRFEKMIRMAGYEDEDTRLFIHDV